MASFLYQSKCGGTFEMVAIGVFCLALLAKRSGAYEFTVGGSTGWAVPSDPNINTLNQWAERNRFQITDSLVFAYAPGNDSVLYVNQDDYNNCNTDSPIAKYVDGHTVFKFNHSGPFYFISGNKDNCLKNEKLVVVVMADRSNKSIAPSSPPAPSSSETNGTSPSLSPSGEQAPSPPPAGTVEINPTPAPAPASEKPSGAGMVPISFAGYVGALVASSLLLAP